MTRKTDLTEEEQDALRQIHQNASTAQQFTIECFLHDRIGEEWLLKMRHATERMEMMIERLEKHKAERRS